MAVALHRQVVESHEESLRAALAAAGLPVADLTDAGRSFYRFSCDSETVGFGGLELHGEAALLRSIVVLSEKRGFGFGHAITIGLLDEAYRKGAGKAYLLTESAAPFFQSLGFRPIARDKAPAEILATRQAASLCAASAALMVRSLLKDPILINRPFVITPLARPSEAELDILPDTHRDASTKEDDEKVLDDGGKRLV